MDRRNVLTKKLTFQEWYDICKYAEAYRKNKQAEEEFDNGGYKKWGFVKGEDGYFYDKNGEFQDTGLMFCNRDGSCWNGTDSQEKIAEALGLLDWDAKDEFNISIPYSGLCEDVYADHSPWKESY